MKRKPAHQVVAEKRQWHYQPTEEDKALGFKGWHSRGYLPHFDAPGIRQFITYRLADSIPAELRHERAAAMQLEDDRERFRQMEVLLDRGLGACHLRDARVARMVQENLWFHDGKAYRLLGWCLMPNHVHVLAEMAKPLSEVLHGWKSYTSSRANKLLNATGGTFWQADYFDRYIRDEEHYRRVVRYIETIRSKRGWCANRRNGPGAARRIVAVTGRMKRHEFRRSANSHVRAKAVQCRPRQLTTVINARARRSIKPKTLEQTVRFPYALPFPLRQRQPVKAICCGG
ncbi:MAG TPA: transposase [Verrucomicrobiae bacterium]|nr:transposase [Verrucomicrobiae bacterium]